MPTFNERINNHAVVFSLGALLVGFVAGIGGYLGALKITDRSTIETQYLETLQQNLAARQERIGVLEDELKDLHAASEQNAAQLKAHYETQLKQAQATLQQTQEAPQDERNRSPASGEQNAAQLKAHYETQLKQAQAIAVDSNTTMPKLAAELAHLRESSEATQRQLTAVRSERDRLSRLTRTQRPVLTFSVEALSSLKEIVFQGRNPTAIPLKVVHTAGMSWVNKTAQVVPYGQTPLMAPGKEAALLTFHMDDQLVSSALIGKTDLRYAVCVIYETESGDTSQRWMANWWFYYEPKFKSLSSLITSAHEAVLTTSQTCDIKQQQPDGWIQ